MKKRTVIYYPGLKNHVFVHTVLVQAQVNCDSQCKDLFFFFEIAANPLHRVMDSVYGKTRACHKILISVK